MKADKRLGQHFLRDVEVLQDIAAIADLERSSGALEIGPGEGALTAWLAGIPSRCRSPPTPTCSPLTN